MRNVPRLRRLPPPTMLQSDPASLRSTSPRATVPEFSIEEPAAEGAALQDQEEQTPDAKAVARTTSPWPTAAARANKITVEPAAVSEFAVVDESSVPSAQAAAASEIDLSSEWDDTITIESDAAAQNAAELDAAKAARAHAIPESSKTNETIDEIRFYARSRHARAGHGSLGQTPDSDQRSGQAG